MATPEDIIQEINKVNKATNGNFVVTFWADSIHVGPSEDDYTMFRRIPNEQELDQVRASLTQFLSPEQGIELFAATRNGAQTVKIVSGRCTAMWHPYERPPKN